MQHNFCIITPPVDGYDDKERDPTVQLLLLEDGDCLDGQLTPALQQWGYAVTQLTDNTLIRPQLQACIFDHIIIDVHSSLLTHQSVLALLEYYGYSTPVLAIVAKQAHRSVRYYLQQGAHDTLLKPFRLEQLLIKLETPLSRRIIRQDRRHQGSYY